jgi:hypothetical protein
MFDEKYHRKVKQIAKVGVLIRDQRTYIDHLTERLENARDVLAILHTHKERLAQGMDDLLEFDIPREALTKVVFGGLDEDDPGAIGTGH